MTFGEASPTTDHWWLEEGELILQQAQAVAVYQYASSPVRRRFPARFYLTDRRLVGVSKRGRTARRRILPIDVPREHIEKSSAERALRTRSTYHRPWFGRRVLRLDIDHQGRELIMGIVLSKDDVDTWAEVLGEDG